jgi:hypothetical protein
VHQDRRRHFCRQSKKDHCPSGKSRRNSGQANTASGLSCSESPVAPGKLDSPTEGNAFTKNDIPPFDGPGPFHHCLMAFFQSCTARWFSWGFSVGGNSSAQAPEKQATQKTPASNKQRHA